MSDQSSLGATQGSHSSSLASPVWPEYALEKWTETNYLNLKVYEDDEEIFL